MSVFPHIVAEPGNGIRRVVCNAVPLKNLRVYPDAVRFALQDYDLAVRADRVEILLCNILIMQEFPFQKEPVTLPA